MWSNRDIIRLVGSRVCHRRLWTRGDASELKKRCLAQDERGTACERTPSAPKRCKRAQARRRMADPASTPYSAYRWPLHAHRALTTSTDSNKSTSYPTVLDQFSTRVGRCREQLVQYGCGHDRDMLHDDFAQTPKIGCPAEAAASGATPSNLGRRRHRRRSCSRAAPTATSRKTAGAERVRALSSGLAPRLRPQTP